jgi:hydrogenase expression/formation protein HypD
MLGDALRTFRDNPELARSLCSRIRSLASRMGPVKFMNFCGTHEWTTVHFGIRSLLPPNVELVAGPGCPVCVTPSYFVEQAIRLALEGVTVYTYGDSYRLPALRAVDGCRSLEEARAAGGRVKLVYSFLESTEEAREESLFFGIGFETLAPIYSSLLLAGKVPRNLKLLSLVKLTPPAARFAIGYHKDRGLLPLSGVIAPGHVSTVIGASSWEFLPKEFGLPTVVAGFEPIDLLVAVLLLLKMCVENRPRVVTEYRRVVSWEGNLPAKESMGRVFETSESSWRGIGVVPDSGLFLKEEFSDFDAYRHFNLERLPHSERDLEPGCRCGEIIVGAARPTDCPLFGKKCTPGSPVGPCMVSVEGPCNIWARFGGGDVPRNGG